MNFIMIGLLFSEALDRLRVRLNMYLVSRRKVLCAHQVSAKRIYAASFGSSLSIVHSCLLLGTVKVKVIVQLL